MQDFALKAVNFIYGKIPQDTPRPDQLARVKLVAHRGAWNQDQYIENTFSAFDRCLNKKIWAVETDVRWTKDDVPVLNHDENFQRLFQWDQKIDQLSVKDIQKRLPQVPSLEEFVHRYAKKLHFFLELKTTPTQHQLESLQSLLSPLSPVQDYHLMSLSTDRLESLKPFPRDCMVSIGRMDIKKVYRQTLENQWGALTGQFLLLNNSMLRECRLKKIKVGTGFPDSKNTFFREVLRGVDWVFTNHAEELSLLL